MAAAVDAGTRVVCVSATAGELGTPDPLAWPPDRLGRLRRWETAAAMAILGVTRPPLPRPARRRPGQGRPGARRRHRRGPASRTSTPATILTFAPARHDVPPRPHGGLALGDEAWRRIRARGPAAARRARGGARRRVRRGLRALGRVHDRRAPAPRSRADDQAVHLRLGGCALDRKLAALHAMASQTRPAVARWATTRYAAEVSRGGVRRRPGLTSATRTVRRERPDRAASDGQDRGITPRGRSRRPRGGPSTPACRPPCPRRCGRRGAPGTCA